MIGSIQSEMIYFVNLSEKRSCSYSSSINNHRFEPHPPHATFNSLTYHAYIKLYRVLFMGHRHTVQTLHCAMSDQDYTMLYLDDVLV